MPRPLWPRSCHGHCGLLTQARRPPTATARQPSIHGHCGLTWAGQPPMVAVALLMQAGHPWPLQGSHPWPLWPCSWRLATHGHYRAATHGRCGLTHGGWPPMAITGQPPMAAVASLMEVGHPWPLQGSHAQPLWPHSCRVGQPIICSIVRNQ